MSILWSSGIGMAAYVRSIVFSPLLSGSLLLTLETIPQSIRATLTNILSSTPIDLPRLKLFLQVLLALSLLRSLNKALESWASNNWRLTASRKWDWPKEIAVVTGGSSGIGLAIVRLLCARGVRVAILDVQPAPEGLLKSLPLARYYRCDVTSAESIDEAATALRRELGGHPSILVNNAGVSSPATILKTSEASLHAMFNVNALAHWLTVQQFLPRMIELDRGHVVTMASLASFVALPRSAHYSATKAAALAFHEALRTELKHFYKSPSVATTVVHPNFVATPLLDGISDSLERSGVKMLSAEDVAAAVVARIWARRGGQVILPGSTSTVSGIRGWPTWAQELLRDVMGSVGARTMSQEPKKRRSV